MDHLINWFSRIVDGLQHIKDLVINRGSSFDLHNLQHTNNPVINELVSLIRSLVTKINGDLLLRVVVALVVVSFLWKMIEAIFGCGKGGKTMKAPGRNYRISRNDFEDDPANYFRNLRK